MTSNAPKPDGREKAHSSRRRCRFGTKCCMYASRRMFSRQVDLLSDMRRLKGAKNASNSRAGKAGKKHATCKRLGSPAVGIRGS